MAKTSGGEIRLQTIGDARITTPIGEIDPSAEMVFAVGLYLLLRHDEEVPRKYLQALLWPDAGDAIASHRLRQTIFKLRGNGLSVLAEGRASLRLSLTRVRIDVDEFKNGSIDAPAVQALDLPLLASFMPKFSPAYSDWLDHERAKLALSLTQALLPRIADARASGNWAAVELVARALLRHSPHNEEGTLALAESLAMRGDKLDAVRILDDYLSELGNSPLDLRFAASTMRRRIGDQPIRTSSDLIEPPLVGREVQMQYLTRLLSRARQGTPTVCFVRGIPGIGKSRLVHEFLSFSRLQGVTCLRAGCRASDASRPLAILLELIPQIRALRGAIGSAPETLAFLDALTTHRPPSQDEKARDSTATPWKLDRALVDLIDAVCEEVPLVLAVDDCQWLDKASALILSNVVSLLQTQRILLLLTSREVIAPLIQEQISNLEEIALSPLADEPAEVLLRFISSQRRREVTPSYVAWSQQIAQGNPFFLQELAIHWAEMGAEHSVPPSLAAVLRKRISRLSTVALHVLQACAVLENHSTIENIELVLGYSAHELLSALSELSEAGMVAVPTKDMVAREGRIASKHDLLSDMALEHLASPALTYLHRRAASVLESKTRDTNDASTLWSCAKHWQHAGDIVQAFRLATSCARHLLEADRPGEASEAYEKAREYCTSEAELLLVLEGHATASYVASDWDAVIRLGEQARSIKRRHTPAASEHDELELMIRQAEWKTFRWQDILEKSKSCLYSSEATIAHRMEAGVTAMMTLVLQSNASESRQVFDEIRRLSRDETAPRAIALSAEMMFETSWGSIDVAVSAAYALVAELRMGRDVAKLSRALCNAGVALRVAGRFDDASDCFQQALGLADEHKLKLSKMTVIPNLAHMALERGRIDDARAWLRALQTCPMPDETKLARIEIASIQARLSILEGRGEAAIREVDALVDMKDDQFPHRRTYWNALRVAAELTAMGAATKESVERLKAEYLLTRSNVFQAFPTFTLYAGLISLGAERSAKKLLDEYITQYRREPWPAQPELLDSLLSRIQKRPPNSAAVGFVS